MRRNQIGSACAGSNPAVRECHTMADVPEWLRGLTRTDAITTRRCVLLCVILSTLTQCGDTE